MAAFQKGTPRHPNAGRRKGTPNKASVDLLERMQQIALEQNGIEDYHPVIALSQIANDATAPIDIRTRAHSEAAKYVAPQRKAVEHSGPNGDPIEVKITLVDKLLEALKK